MFDGTLSLASLAEINFTEWYAREFGSAKELVLAKNFCELPYKSAFLEFEPRQHPQFHRSPLLPARSLLLLSWKIYSHLSPL